MTEADGLRRAKACYSEKAIAAEESQAMGTEPAGGIALTLRIMRHRTSRGFMLVTC